MIINCIGSINYFLLNIFLLLAQGNHYSVRKITFSFPIIYRGRAVAPFIIPGLHPGLPIFRPYWA